MSQSAWTSRTSVAQPRWCKHEGHWTHDPFGAAAGPGWGERGVGCMLERRVGTTRARGAYAEGHRTHDPFGAAAGPGWGERGGEGALPNQIAARPNQDAARPNQDVARM